MKFKGVLFDLDGTLLDTSELIIKSFNHTMNKHYQRNADIEVVRSYFGRPLRTAMEFMGPDKVEELIASYREYNLLHHDSSVKVFSGVAEVIRQLYEAGILLAVVTSKTHATAIRGLRLFNLDKYFTSVIGCERSLKHKPDPEPVSVALSDLNVPANECLMVGDSPYDLISAKSAGVKTAAVSWSDLPLATLLAENPDYIVNSMEELLSICEV